MPKTTWILATLAAALAVALVLWRDGSSRETAETSPLPVAVDLAGHRLELPMNAIRFPAQRRPGPQERLDLALLFPEWTGRTPADADRFDETGGGVDVIWVTLAPAGAEMDQAARLATVYARLFVGDPLEADVDLGLVGRHLSPEAGYVGEEVWFEPGVVHPFVARCWPLAPNGPVTTCLNEEIVDGVMVGRRFPRAHLARWREIRDGLDARLAQGGLGSPRGEP